VRKMVDGSRARKIGKEGSGEGEDRRRGEGDGEGETGRGREGTEWARERGLDGGGRGAGYGRERSGIWPGEERDKVGRGDGMGSREMRWDRGRWRMGDRTRAHWAALRNDHVITPLARARRVTFSLNFQHVIV
jgi:hypothetical protein